MGQQSSGPLFGAQPITHIANASSYVVWGRAITKDSPKPKPILSLSPKNFNEAGLTKINPGEFAQFSPQVGWLDGSHISRATVYVTAYIVNDNGMLECIASDHSVKDNTSVIITPNNQLRITKMGTRWTDIFDVNHDPSKRREPKISDANKRLKKMADEKPTTVEKSSTSNLTWKKEETTNNFITNNTKTLFEKFIQENSSSMVGTPVYFPPERFQDVKYGVRSDVWSLGITLAEIAYGKIPYDIALSDSDSNLYFKMMEILSVINKEDLIQKCYGKKYSKGAHDFLEACLESYENRPKYDGLQKKEFYIRYKESDCKPNIADLVKKMEDLLKDV
uniref:mitogen-activated protein kinase kinase n=1 Tax=Acrobeloides nanus TaxID=290746 RepID=A0A914CA94_9BILA